MARTATAVRAAAVEFRDATASYDRHAAQGEPPKEVSERLHAAYTAFGEATGIMFATDEDALVELLLEILPEAT